MATYRKWPYSPVIPDLTFSTYKQVKISFYLEMFFSNAPEEFLDKKKTKKNDRHEKEMSKKGLHLKYFYSIFHKILSLIFTPVELEFYFLLLMSVYFR